MKEKKNEHLCCTVLLLRERASSLCP